MNVNPERMLAELAEFRQIGALGKGVARSAFSDPDVQARRLLAERIEAAGLTASCDACGNVFGVPDSDKPCVLIGSHSDSQPKGGWLDGIFGVLAGLEVARAMRESGGPPVAVVSFQDEEGWFGSLTGSSVWSGEADLGTVDALRDVNGQSFAEARKRVSEIAPVGEISPSRFTAFIEPHIEQGPVLDTAGEKLGIVDAIVGMRGFDVTFTGQANHAGTTPMALRRDAFQGMARYVYELNAAMKAKAGERSVWTSGRIAVEPNAPSIVPMTARVSVQMRDPSHDVLEAMKAAATSLAEQIAAEHQLELEFTPGPSHEPHAMNQSVVAALEAAAQEIAPGKWRRMPSGALHDALNVAAVLPSSVLFVPSKRGISHSPEEDTDPQDLALGLKALEVAVREIAPVS